ncbi:MAG: glycoside hydrolase family 9 protein [Anaerolineae bacterium]|nr:glycoside hydrolase family 9 protein [Anaerolineae bacterium]
MKKLGLIVLMLVCVASLQAQDAPESEIIPTISVNQVGYFPQGVKQAVVTAASDNDLRWELVDTATEVTVAEGALSDSRFDEASGDTVRIADFSDFTQHGTYRLVTSSVQSTPFTIGEDVYNQLKIDALRYFYLNRSGIPLEETYAGEWSRPAGHLTDAEITCFQGVAPDRSQWDGCDYTLDGSGGWYDAGDYGKYVVNGGIALWTLQNFYERYPEVFADGSLNIPESGNGLPDILDEARWEMEFLLRMQLPEDDPQAGLAFHKLHDRNWSGVPVMPPTEYNNDNDHSSPNTGRYVYQPTTAATLNLAATAAQCARVWQELDPAFAERCLNAAETAWAAAQKFPNLLAGSVPGGGGGDYGDGYIVDEFFWAAAELYITTAEEEYHSAMDRYSTAWKGSGPLTFYWGGVAPLGLISLFSVSNNMPTNELDAVRERLISAADDALSLIESGAYRIPLSLDGFVWGSNSGALNNALVMGVAYDITDNPAYLSGVSAGMDYLLGVNPLAFSYVTGYGTNYAQHPHHRFWGNQPNRGFPPPPPGAVVGGPLSSPAEETTQRYADLSSGVAKRYVDRIEAYSSNEVAINWNAPLVWVSGYLDFKLNNKQ